MAKHFDFLCIGAGSGGIAAANRAAKHGAKCAIIEANDMGGTCVNLGCVPKKVMWQAAHMAEALNLSKHYGFDVAMGNFSFEHLVLKRQAYIERLRKIYVSKLQEMNITYFRGIAEFVDDHQVLVDEEIISAEHILIATGSQAQVPDISGADFGMTSDGFFQLKQLPKRVAVIGAGYIALELAGILNRLGSRTHLVYRHERPLRSYDTTMVNMLTEIMDNQGIKHHPNQTAKSIQRNANGTYQVNFQSGSVLEDIDSVIWAIGRRANTNALKLNNAGIELDNHENIIVDEWQNTTTKNIYAVGDVTGRAPLTPVAIAAGRRLADRLFAQREIKLDYANIPTVIFTQPPFASVGLSETEARKQYEDEAIVCYQSKFHAMKYAISDKQTPTLIKIVCYRDKVVGLHMLGEYADEILQGFAVAIKLGLTMQDLRDTVAIHPTSAEEIVTIDP